MNYLIEITVATVLGYALNHYRENKAMNSLMQPVLITYRQYIV